MGRTDVASEVDTPLAVFRLGLDGLLYARAKAVPQTPSDAEASLRLALPLLGHGTTALVADIRSMHSVPIAVQRLYARSELAQRLSAVALVAGGPFNRIAGNLLLATLGAAGGTMPARLFEDAPSAAAWARTHAPSLALRHARPADAPLSDATS